MLKVFLSGQFPETWIARFSESYDLSVYDSVKVGKILERADLAERLQNQHVFITELDEVDAALMDQVPSLIMIGALRGNPVNIDVKAATQRGIAVFNTPARNADAVADFTVMLMIMTARHVFQAMRAMYDNLWVERGRVDNYHRHMGYEICGKTVGLIGFGAIGRKVAQRLCGFNAHILAYDPFVTEAEGVEMVDLKTLLQRSDFVSLHAPVTAETVGMIGHSEFDWMKETAYFINTARAALVDDDALLDALRTHKIAGAGIDVFPQEPIAPDYPLLALDNVVATPHLGGASHDVSQHHTAMAYQSLQGLFEGNPVNIVNPEVFSIARDRINKIGV